MIKSQADTLGTTRTSSDVDLSLIILTRNEELHIGRAITSMQNFAGTAEMWVVDSFSDDNTVEIATALGAKVVTHAFTTHSHQLAWALATLPLRGRWTMRLDADEVPDQQLLDSLKQSIDGSPNSKFDGLECTRAYVFMGRRLAHGGRSSQRTVRVWRTGSAFVEERAMDEHVIVRSGDVGSLKGEIQDHNLKGISDFIDKHVSYSKREAYDVLVRELRADAGSRVRLASRRARLTRFFKEEIYNRIPGPVAPLLLFAWRYFVLGGLLDGLPGFYYHMLQSVWYRSVVQMQIAQARQHFGDTGIALGKNSLAEYFQFVSSTPDSVARSND